MADGEQTKMVNRITIKRLSEIMRTIPLLCTGLPGYRYPDESRPASLSAFPGQGVGNDARE